MNEAASKDNTASGNQEDAVASEQHALRDSSYTLPRSKILRGRTNFQRLFSPKADTLHGRSVNFRFRVYPDRSEGCLVGFIVRTSLGKAAKRNRLKRQLREAYRMHQHLLGELFDHGSFGLHGAFLAKRLPIDSQTVQQEVRGLLVELRQYLQTQGYVNA
ncbi:MAG: ribonuclease P protein component [Bacteroidota bacterium]